MISKVYDVPVYQNWYEVKIEADRRTAERWIYVEFKEVFHQKREGEHSCTEIAIGEADQTKTLKVTIDTDDDGEYTFIFSIDGLALVDYINEYKIRHSTWLIENEEGNVIYFKRTEIATKKTHPSFEEFTWEAKFKEEYTFRIVKRLRGMGEWTTTLFVNGEENKIEFNPRSG